MADDIEFLNAAFASVRRVEPLPGLHPTIQAAYTRELQRQARQQKRAKRAQRRAEGAQTRVRCICGISVSGHGSKQVVLLEHLQQCPFLTTHERAWAARLARILAEKDHHAQLRQEVDR